jgi:protein TonB
MLLNKVRNASGDPPTTTDRSHPLQPFAERHRYRPAGSNRWIGLGGTTLIYALVLASFFFTISTTRVSKAPSASLTVIDIRPPAAPAEAMPEERQSPEPTRKEAESDPAPVKPIEPTLVPILPAMAPVPAQAPKSTEPAPREPETAAPKAAPASSAPRASDGPDSWEGRVLAALNKRLRYPRAAQLRRQQGVPWVRFVMDREGKVLSVRLERSSGIADLDREAVALPKRAQPLPKPPADRPGSALELVVPVEFFLR